MPSYPDPAAKKYPQNEIMAKKPKKPSATAEVWGNPDPSLPAKVKAEHDALQWGSPNPALMRRSGGSGGMIGNVAAALGGAAAGAPPSLQGAPFPYDKRMQVDLPGAVSRVGSAIGNAVAPVVGWMNQKMMGVHPSAAAPMAANRPPMDRPETGTYYDERAPKTTEPAPPTRQYINNPQPWPTAENRPSVGMGDVRMADQRMQVDLPPPVQQRQQNPNSELPPLPFNDRKARQRAQADYQRILHTDSQGLDPMARENRIGMIRDREDIRDAYARQNRPLQKVQTPGEIADRHSELGRSLVSGFRTELEGIDQQINALQNEPLSDDRIRRGEILAAQRANKAAQLQKAMTDPYWQQTTPERAGQIQAGQQRLNDRQQADRVSGAADVAAYQDRQQYDRNLEDTVRQRQIAEKMAESRAREAQSQAIIDNKGQTPQDRIAGAQADAEVAKANAITRVLGSPDAAKRFEDNFKRENGLTGSSPEQIQLAGNMLDTTLQKMGDLAGETWFTNNGQIDYTNRENMDASLDIADSAVSKLEAAFADYPGDVAARAAMLLASMPPWMSQGGAFPRWIEPWNKSNRDTANRLNAVGTRLKALAGIGSGQAQGQ